MHARVLSGAAAVIGALSLLGVVGLQFWHLTESDSGGRLIGLAALFALGGCALGLLGTAFHWVQRVGRPGAAGGVVGVTPNPAVLARRGR